MTKMPGYALVVSAMLMFGTSLTAVNSAALADSSPSPEDGFRVFKSANCVGCHKWSGDGGGGYGGAAANLRRTALTKDQIEETIRCGRPSTGMPHFDADAYSDGRCYGMTKADLTSETRPPEPGHFLQSADVDAVAIYVVTRIKGKGDPTFAQCQAFFGTTTRACDMYPKSDEATQTTTLSGGAATDLHGHPQIETAPDANSSTAGKSNVPHPPSLRIETGPDANASGSARK